MLREPQRQLVVIGHTAFSQLLDDFGCRLFGVCEPLFTDQADREGERPLAVVVYSEDAPQLDPVVAQGSPEFNRCDDVITTATHDIFPICRGTRTTVL